MATLPEEKTISCTSSIDSGAAIAIDNTVNDSISTKSTIEAKLEQQQSQSKVLQEKQEQQQEQQQQYDNDSNSKNSNSKSSHHHHMNNSRIGENVVLEYTRDSPMFMNQSQNLYESLNGLKKYSQNILQVTENYIHAGETFIKCGHLLSEQLLNSQKSKEYSRSLFSNAFEKELPNNCGGDINKEIIEFADMISKMNHLQSKLLKKMDLEMCHNLNILINEDMSDIHQLTKQTMKNKIIYENSLSKTISNIENFNNMDIDGDNHNNNNNNNNEDSKVMDVIHQRNLYEKVRFDMTASLNQIDSLKKLRILSGINGVVSGMNEFFQMGNQDIFTTEKKSHISDMFNGLQCAKLNFNKESEMWKCARQRLHAELENKLPPPGAPPGAQCTVTPRQQLNNANKKNLNKNLNSQSDSDSQCSLSHFLPTITTEVNSLKTPLRSEGVLKQGYLFNVTPDTGLMSFMNINKRQRSWHRLHNGKLYSVLNNMDSKLLCNVCCDGFKVYINDSKLPFAFTLSNTFIESEDNNNNNTNNSNNDNNNDSTKESQFSFDFQADNEDEMMNWIQAIRRCRTRYYMNSTVSDEISSERANLLTNFISQDGNQICCECSDTSVTWISVNIGCTLCDQCSNIHRTLLSSDESKLRSIDLDEWSLPVLKCLIGHVGNQIVNSVWECQIANGWKKPLHDVPYEKKAEWINAKYQWYGFVDEDRGNVEYMSRLLADSAENGHFDKIMFAIAHKGNPNWKNPEQSNKTALHFATAGKYVDIVVYLILNGAQIDSLDDMEISPYTVAKVSGIKELINVFKLADDGELVI